MAVDEEILNDLVRKELGIFNVGELDKISRRLNGMSESDFKAYAAQLAVVKNLIDDIIKYGIWLQYDLLAKFDIDYSMLAKGGINALSVLKEYIDNIVAKHQSDIEESREIFNPHTPLPE